MSTPSSRRSWSCAARVPAAGAALKSKVRLRPYRLQLSCHTVELSAFRRCLVYCRAEVALFRIETRAPRARVRATHRTCARPAAPTPRARRRGVGRCAAAVGRCCFWVRIPAPGGHNTLSDRTQARNWQVSSTQRLHRTRNTPPHATRTPQRAPAHLLQLAVLTQGRSSGLCMGAFRGEAARPQRESCAMRAGELCASLSTSCML